MILPILPGVGCKGKLSTDSHEHQLGQRSSAEDMPEAFISKRANSRLMLKQSERQEPERKTEAQRETRGFFRARGLLWLW